MLSDFQQTFKDQGLHELNGCGHGGRHFPARTTRHDANGIGLGALSHVLDHALNGSSDGKGAATRQGVARVGGKGGHFTRWDPESCGARL